MVWGGRSKEMTDQIDWTKETEDLQSDIAKPLIETHGRWLDASKVVEIYPYLYAVSKEQLLTQLHNIYYEFGNENGADYLSIEIIGEILNFAKLGESVISFDIEDKDWHDSVDAKWRASEG